MYINNVPIKIFGPVIEVMVHVAVPMSVLVLVQVMLVEAAAGFDGLLLRWGTLLVYVSSQLHNIYIYDFMKSLKKCQ